MLADKFRPQPGDTIMSTEIRNQERSVDDYNKLRNATLAAGFPRGQLAELENICGKSTRALQARFQEWQRINKDIL